MTRKRTVNELTASTNARLAELERDVHFLQADLAALSIQSAMTPTVFVAAGSQQNITPGNPAKLAALEVVAETSSVLFPTLSTEANGAKDSAILAPLQGAYSSTGPSAILVECSEGSGGSAAYHAHVNIAALKLATVNPSLRQQ